MSHIIEGEGKVLDYPSCKTVQNRFNKMSEISFCREKIVFKEYFDKKAKKEVG